MDFFIQLDRIAVSPPPGRLNPILENQCSLPMGHPDSDMIPGASPYIPTSNRCVTMCTSMSSVWSRAMWAQIMDEREQSMKTILSGKELFPLDLQCVHRADWYTEVAVGALLLYDYG